MLSPSFTEIGGGILAPEGFIGNAVCCGIKNPTASRLDLAIIFSAYPCTSSGTFTTNQVKAACVKVCQAHLRQGGVRAIVANSGNANACTGKQGMTDAKNTCHDVATELGINAKEVAVCSTGVIGLPMPMVRITPRFEPLVEGMSRTKGLDIAQAIITSDTTHKEIAVQVKMGNKSFKIGACCKGAGMINPNMATMLCFITTDAGVETSILDACTLTAVEQSFNCITIDGDMSTNDSVIVLANAQSGINIESPQDIATFQSALNYVMLTMAKRVVQDGERVTKFVTVQVQGARNSIDARHAAMAVANSQLVKSSWNGNDPNWGRIIHAIGYSQAKIIQNKVDIDIAGLPACRHGEQTDTPSDALRHAVQVRDFVIHINLNQGKGTHTVYTTDLSPEYVDFNRSEYAYWNQAKADGLTK